jgi:hypothetical protein
MNSFILVKLEAKEVKMQHVLGLSNLALSGLLTENLAHTQENAAVRRGRREGEL